MAEHGPIRLIASEQPRLAQEFQSFPTTVWASPSRCDGWSNARVVAHLAVHAQAYADTITRALRGDSAPPPGPDGRRLTNDEFLAWAHAREEALAGQAPGELLRELSRSGDELTAVFERLGPTDLERPAWHAYGDLTVGTLVAYRVYELAFHAWDVRATLDPVAQIRPELCPFLVGMVRQLQSVLCAPERSLEGTCRFQVDGQSWITHIGDGKLEEISHAGAPDAVVRTDANTVLLLATMRQTLSDCVDRLSMEGSRDLAVRMLGASRFRV